MGNATGKRVVTGPIEATAINPIEILDKWLKVNPDFWKIKAAARCIEEIGTRKDLKILEVSPRDLPEDHWLISEVKESAKFAVYRRTLQ